MERDRMRGIVNVMMPDVYRQLMRKKAKEQESEETDKQTDSSWMDRV